MLALLVVLVLWIVLSGGGDDDKNGKGKGGPSPAASITPGPSATGPVVPGEPGGRDQPGDANGGADGGSTGSGSGSAGSGSAGSGSAGSGSAGTGTGGAGGGAGAGGAGGASGAGGAGGSGQQVPANSSLPNCAAGAVELTLSAVKVQVPVDEPAKFMVTAKNTSAAACKLDLGPEGAVVTVKNDSSEKVWSSKDCVKGARNVFFQLPAKGQVTQVVTWDRKPSDAAKCDVPAGGPVAPGTYVVELAGAKFPASVSLQKD
ncbi:hypothetical protein GCM10010329_67550 [Streptomyces spiroverticillatus]|uniref:DUF4232 domain-containing protein n=1 Tax=Streptomyces finlayi TaxID=67296 RepID=A0A918X4U4_9ACTN|nr:hypothetical protein GCM10010329_67550 [Streptomyces spiroverticillatus]GHD12217.1 hypothetical protein GCM10010334_69100 [Streptomyces finlayi]